MAEKQELQKMTFVRDYTRDMSIIMEQAWSDCIEYIYADILKEDMPSEIPCIFYVNHGVIEIWDNVKVFTRLKELLYDYNKSNPTFIFDVLKSFSTHLKETQKIRKDGGKLKDASALAGFVEMVNEAAAEWAIFDYTARFDDTEDKIRKLCHDAREVDTFWDDADYIIRTTLASLYKDRQPNENLILKEEIYNAPEGIELSRRAKGFVYIPNKLSQENVLSSINKRYSNIIFKYPKGKIHNNTLSGKIAYGEGLRRGRVRVLFKKNDVHLLQKGEVLVAPMTTPDFTTAMKRAAAVVTDEGGITCHAAVVAREMKIFCLTGTHTATSFLKDGDLVEVNADEGIVRVLEEDM